MDVDAGQAPAPRAPAGTALDARRAAPRVRASWQRSESYGVSLDEVTPAFTGSFDTGSLLYECGKQVLAGLQHTLAGEPISLMIADRDGVVLARLCNDVAIRRSLDRVHLAPGFSYAERFAGTNGLGLSLADRVPTLVRGAEHWCTALRGYTCAAVPVLDPTSGDLAGSVNLTTWSDSSSELLLALAQAAAGTTSALMLARSAGKHVQPAPRGEVFHVYGERAPAGGDEHPDPCRSRPWRSALTETGDALAAGRVVAVVGEAGAGRATAVAAARRALSPRARILRARPPAENLAAWCELWAPELHDAQTCVIVSGVEALPQRAAADLAAVLGPARRPGVAPFALTAPSFADLPGPLAALVDAVVEVPPLRHRTEDVAPLARYVARQERHRDVGFTASAVRALEAYRWPGNVAELRRVVRDAAARTDSVDLRHLPPEVFSVGTRALTRLEVVERDEIVRCLTEPGTTTAHAAATLGMARATIYRKIAQYGIEVPGRSPGRR